MAQSAALGLVSAMRQLHAGSWDSKTTVNRNNQAPILEPPPFIWNKDMFAN